MSQPRGEKTRLRGSCVGGIVVIGLAGSCDAGSDVSNVESSLEAGACRPIVARSYDSERDCYGPEETLAGLCFRETVPSTTSGVWEIACLISPEGTRYATRKGYSECLEGDGWTTEDAFGTGGGWTVRGSSGLCLTGTHLTLADGSRLDDTLCDAAISRGLWDFGPTGFGSGALIVLDGGPAPGDAGQYAGECR